MAQARVLEVVSWPAAMNVSTCLFFLPRVSYHVALIFLIEKGTSYMSDQVILVPIFPNSL